jgi:hypothetical protein
MREVIYQPSEKKLHLVFEFVDLDLKKYLNKNKNNVSNYQIKVKINFKINKLT